MIVIVLGSVVLGLIAAVVAMISGMSFGLAVLIYAGVGVLMIALVLIRTLICLRLKETKRLLNASA